MLRLFRRLLWGIAVALAWSNAYASDNGIMGGIGGTITVRPDLESVLAVTDRLVLKLYHPDDGIEKDTRYWIIDRVELPRDFDIAPSTDMNGKTRWSTYMLEVFTDRDGDVLNNVPGELFAKTNDLIPLGTGGLQLELGDPEH